MDLHQVGGGEMHSLATRVHVNTPSRWAEAHKGANSARRIFFGGCLGFLSLS